MTVPTTWLVGMNNPYGSDERFALYPGPRNSAGDRLCRLVLGVSTHDYMRHFVRTNTVAGPWSAASALRGARGLFLRLPAGATVVLLGKPVWQAWRRVVPERLPDKKWEAFRVCRDEVKDLAFVLLPHPSGLCRLWNDEGAYSRARRAILEASPGLSAVISQ